MGFSGSTRNLSIRQKLGLGYLSVFGVVMLASVVVYAMVQRTVREDIQANLHNTTALITDLVRTSAQVSIRNRLRAVAEKNREVVWHYYDQHERGLISEDAARRLATEVLLSQHIGSTGYLYVVDSRGVLQVHPVGSLLGTQQQDHTFILDQVDRKEGYLEYQWANPGEEAQRPKALYMAYFEPWDWIISASSYREEFEELVDVHDFEEALQRVELGPSGYVFVIDGQGEIVLHPMLEGSALGLENEQGLKIIDEIIELRQGTLQYTWRNPGEARDRQKLAVFDEVEELDWIVVSSSYEEDFLVPLRRIRFLFGLTAALLILLMAPLSLLVSAAVTRPLRELMATLRLARAGDLSVRVPVSSADEVGRLSAHFNHFLDQLQEREQQRDQALEEQQRLQKQLRHAEKLEAIGRLAGGVAHDFNNILTAIIGHTQMLHGQVAPDQKQHTKQILVASSRASELVRKLLSFGRKGSIQQAPVDAHGLVAEVCLLLRHSIDKRITIETDLCAPRALVRGDASVLQNTLLNIALNARDAMPDGGTLSFASREERDEDGQGWLHLDISDTGVGMDEQTRARVFEPFFTTKAVGEGTGLGLASAYGCVQHHGGTLAVHSEPGQGTRFSMRLPLPDRPPTPVAATRRQAPTPGQGHVVLVDDERLVRTFASRALTGLGYRVTTLEDGQAAVDYLRERASEVSIVLLDLMMPRLDGIDTFTHIHRLDPHLPVVLCSGYSERATDGLPDGMADFLAKPYYLEDLALVVERNQRKV